MALLLIYQHGYLERACKPIKRKSICIANDDAWALHVVKKMENFIGLLLFLTMQYMVKLLVWRFLIAQLARLQMLLVKL